MSRMNADQLLDRIVVALRDEPIPEFIDPCSPVQSVELPLDRPTLPQRRKSSRRLMAGATLALLAALAVSLLTIFPATHPIAAFAEVRQAVSNLKSVRYRCLDFHGDKDPYVTTVVTVQRLGSRGEGPDGSELITNLRARRMLWLDHRGRKARLSQIYIENNNGLDEFDKKMRNLPADAKELAPAEFNGKKVRQFTVSNSGEYLVFVDPETKLPLRMELKLNKGGERGEPFREVITDFLFDAPVSESLFEIDIPAGYAVERCEEPPDRKPIDTRTLTVSPTKGVGPVPMKAPEDEVIALFGTPDWIEIQGHFPKSLPAPGKALRLAEGGIVHKMLHYDSLGFHVQVLSEGGMTQFHCLPESIAVRKFLGKTDAGVMLGASIDEVIKAYGTPEVWVRFRQQVLNYPHKGWSFVFGDGKLASYTASEPLWDQVEIIDHGDGSWTERVKQK